jgi:hypothetical protein
MTQTSNNPTAYPTASNKIYILIASQYASDGTIASSVSLDFIQVRVDIARTPDVVAPIPINLPKYWAMLVQGFSPAWDSTDTKDSRRLWFLFKDAQNYLALYRSSTSKFIIRGKINGADVANYTTSATQTHGKYQSFSLLFSHANGLGKMHTIKNNGVVEVASVVMSTEFMNGACPLYALNSDINQQSDALASKFILYDLQKMGKVKFGGELVTNGDFSQGGTGWVVESGTWDFGNAKASIVCTAIYQAIYQNIPATPNTDYVLVGKLTNNARFFVRYLDASNNILGTTNILFSDGTVSFTTPSNCV